MSIDKIFQYLGVLWSGLAFVAAAAFFIGGEWENWQRVKAAVFDNVDPETTVSTVIGLEEALSNLHDRIDGIQLTARDAGVSPEYGCGNTQKTTETSLLVMHGLRDGTNCEVSNLNYLKELQLVIPD